MPMCPSELVGLTPPLGLRATARPGALAAAGSLEEGLTSRNFCDVRRADFGRSLALAALLGNAAVPAPPPSPEPVPLEAKFASSDAEPAASRPSPPASSLEPAVSAELMTPPPRPRPSRRAGDATVAVDPAMSAWPHASVELVMPAELAPPPPLRHRLASRQGGDFTAAVAKSAAAAALPPRPSRRADDAAAVVAEAVDAVDQQAAAHADQRPALSAPLAAAATASRARRPAPAQSPPRASVPAKAAPPPATPPPRSRAAGRDAALAVAAASTVGRPRAERQSDLQPVRCPEQGCTEFWVDAGLVRSAAALSCFICGHTFCGRCSGLPQLQRLCEGCRAGPRRRLLFKRCEQTSTQECTCDVPLCSLCGKYLAGSAACASEGSMSSSSSCCGSLGDLLPVRPRRLPW